MYQIVARIFGVKIVVIFGDLNTLMYVVDGFKETKAVAKPSGVWKTLTELLNPVGGTNHIQNNIQKTLEHMIFRYIYVGIPIDCDAAFLQIRRQALALMGDEAWALSVLGGTSLLDLFRGPLQQLLHVHLILQ
ncbi:hypothetical protein SADUNF_Sadunf14G0066800 [Salix dunnii]|uniref:Uncharacterized protein n=1 Tax=Salix dunnii TaxID=1413687 RepID=A0A835JF29_9ROSI|nr:hypothetical protein SADUNF_Sadunf14G0066800 [Salix dunnii]